MADEVKKDQKETKDQDDKKESATADQLATSINKEEAAKKGKNGKEVKTSPKLSKIIEEIEKLSVLELNDLVKALEEKFGVSAMPQMAAPSAGAGTGDTSEKAAPEQTTFNVVLTETGAQKIQVIKAVREIDQNLGLKQAKDLVDAAPKEILAGVNKETAEEAKKKLESAGAKVELK